MASWRPLPGVVRSQRALTVSLVQVSCRRYQPRGLLRTLPSCASTSTYGWACCARSGWAVPGCFAGERWALGCCGGVLEACGWRPGACAGRGVG